MSNFDFEKNLASPQWLTDVLAGNGFLTAGKVVLVDQQATLTDCTVVSRFYALKVYYSSDSSGRMPSDILMKLTEPGFHKMGQKEADFYRLVKDHGSVLPLATCFGCEFSPQGDRCVLLLDDLRQSHCGPSTPWPQPPPEEQCNEAIAALAKVHAHWWNHDARAEPGFEQPELWSKAWVQRAEGLFRQFVDSVASPLLDDHQSTYELVFEMLPDALLRRLGSSNQRTLIHGDAHFWNFLYPRSGGREGCIIIDWQLCKFGLGGFDLSYMIALHWYPEHRQSLERLLLRYYQTQMHRNNVECEWNDLWDDYRLAVAFNLLYPVLLQSKGVPSVIWQPHLERGFAAFEDLDCRELL
ncbi:MAG: aminoglycoside phosphotransferase family protein [Proteobacteria bacterium]|nr:aminoglycoside phosphotransferase family protein [Pseudomonadota bacterium]